MNVAFWDPFPSPLISLFGFAVLLAIIFFSYAIFQDQKQWFFKVVVFQCLSHTVLGSVLGIMGNLKPHPILVAECVIAVVLGFVVAKKRPSFWTRENFVNIDFALIVLLLVSGFFYWKAKFDFTGVANSESFGLIHVNHLRQPFPNLSDEWYAAYFSKFSFKSGLLPFWQDIFGETRPFFNIQFPFHVLNTMIFGALHLDPMHGYIFLNIGFNLILIASIYLYLRACDVPVICRFVGSLSVPLIGCCAFLPTVWFYIPVHLGFIFFICLLAFSLPIWQSLNQDFGQIPSNEVRSFSVWQVAAGLGSLIFYPLLVPYVALIVLIPFIRLRRYRQVSVFFAALALCCVALIIFTSMHELMKLEDIFRYAMARLVFANSDFVYAHAYNLLVIVSPLVWVGLLFLLSSKLRFGPDSILLLVLFMQFGFQYFTKLNLFLSEPRLVFFLTIALVIVASSGLDQFLAWTGTLGVDRRLGSLILLGVLVPDFSKYTERDFQRYVSTTLSDDSKVKIDSGSSIAIQLMQDDLTLFRDFHKKFIFSTPWKSTVLAVATDNYFQTIRSGTISTEESKDLFQKYYNMDCKQRANFSWYVNLFYFPPMDGLDCDFMKLLGVSSSGYRLYENTLTPP